MDISKIIDSYKSDPIEDYELYDNCKSFIFGNKPNINEINYIRDYFICKIQNEKIILMILYQTM